MNNQYRITPAIKLLTYLAVVLTFFVRPFALGLDHSLLTNALLAFVSILIALNTPSTLYNRNKIFIILFLIYLVFGIYMTTRGGDTNAIVQVMQLFTVYFLFKNYSVMQLYFKSLKNVFLVLILLAIVNFILEINIGDRDALILIRDIPYNNKTYEFSLYFPLTWSKMGWGNFGFFLLGGVLSRQYFFFIEPGMAPPFFTAFIIFIWNDESEKKKWFQTIILLIGIFLTYSTGGPLILMLALSVWYFSKNRKKMSLFTLLLFAAGMGIAWYAYNYMPFFGRMAKLDYTSGTAESVETHENVGQSIIIGAALLIIYGLFSLKLKKDKVIPIVLTAIVILGYMSNYIGYTTLASMLLFWDKIPQRNNIMVERRNVNNILNKQDKTID